MKTVFFVILNLCASNHALPSFLMEEVLCSLKCPPWLCQSSPENSKDIVLNFPIPSTKNFKVMKLLVWPLSILVFHLIFVERIRNVRTKRICSPNVLYFWWALNDFKLVQTSFSLTSLNAPELHASGDVREPISWPQAILCSWSWTPLVYTEYHFPSFVLWFAAIAGELKKKARKSRRRRRRPRRVARQNGRRRHKEPPACLTLAPSIGGEEQSSSGQLNNN